MESKMKNNNPIEETISFYEQVAIKEVNPEWEMKLQKKLGHIPKNNELKFLPLFSVLVINLILTLFSIHKHQNKLNIQEKEIAYKTIRNQFFVNPF